MKRAIIFADHNIIQVYVDDLGTIDDIDIIHKDDKVYVEVDAFMKAIGWKPEEEDDLMQIYTYRRL